MCVVGRLGTTRFVGRDLLSYALPFKHGHGKFSLTGFRDDKCSTNRILHFANFHRTRSMELVSDPCTKDFFLS